MHLIDALEIHVVHSCNLTCESCSHYSNQGHDGIVSLAEADQWMRAWHHRVRPRTFSLLGGEPTIHPQLTDFVSGNSNVYTKNPDYWDKEKIGGQEYKLPFVDKITYRIIKDEATYVTALRTGKLDMLEAIRWQNVDSLKKSAPQLQWNRWLNQSGTFMAMRVDVDGPFKDIRVRRALNYAVNKQEIVQAYYNGNAELFSYPQHPDYVGYFEPLDKQPASVQELFKYDPAKAKKLLAEAGFPKGFTTKVQVCSCNPDHMDLLPLVAGYLEQVGVKLEIQPMEYGAFLSAMTTKTNAAGYMMQNGHTNPTTSIRKSFVTKQTWNPSQYSDPDFDKRMAAVYLERDESKRQLLIKLMTRDILEKAPYSIGWISSFTPTCSR